MSSRCTTSWNFSRVLDLYPFCECFFIGDRTGADIAPELTRLDMSPTNRVAYLREKAECLQA